MMKGAFYKAGLALWNSLLLPIRQLSNLEIFKKELRAFNFMENNCESNSSGVHSWSPVVKHFQEQIAQTN